MTAPIRSTLAVFLLFCLSGCYTQLRDPSLPDEGSSRPSYSGNDPAPDHFHQGPQFFHPYDVRLPAYWWADPYLSPYAVWWSGRAYDRWGMHSSYDPGWSRWRFAFHHLSSWDPWYYPHSQYWAHGGPAYGAVPVYAVPWWQVRSGGWSGGYRRYPGRRGYGDSGGARVVVVSGQDDERETPPGPVRPAIRRAGFGGSGATAAGSSRKDPPREHIRQRAPDNAGPPPSDGGSSSGQQTVTKTSGASAPAGKKDKDEKEEPTREEKRESARRRGGMN